MRTRITSLFPAIALCALLAALSGCGQSQQAAAPAAAEPEVTVVTIAPERVTLTTVLPGRTSAYLVAEVRPQVGGIVQKRLFKEGSDVRAGELLYQIDPATYQAAYDNARASLAKAEANALPARLKAERFGSLSKVNAVSKQDNDDAQAAHQQAQAEVISAKAALESARINLSYTRVTAPIAGRICKSSVTPGALVTASQTAVLATVQQIDPIYVDVTQSSGEVLRLKHDLASGRLKKAGVAGTDGAKVTLLLEDGSPYAQEGVLQFSDITVDQSTGVITLRAVFPNTNHDLLPGLYVRAVLEEGVEDQALLAPQAAVSRDTKGNPMVLVVKPDGVVESRPIEVGRVVGDKWLVTSGLAAGERIIVDGLQKARPGAKVKAVEAAAPATPQAAEANAASAGGQNAPKTESAPEAAKRMKPEGLKDQAMSPERADASRDGLPRPKKGDKTVYSQPKAESQPEAASPATPEQQPEQK